VETVGAAPVDWVPDVDGIVKFCVVPWACGAIEVLGADICGPVPEVGGVGVECGVLAVSDDDDNEDSCALVPAASANVGVVWRGCHCWCWCESDRTIGTWYGDPVESEFWHSVWFTSE